MKPWEEERSSFNLYYVNAKLKSEITLFIIVLKWKNSDNSCSVTSSTQNLKETLTREGRTLFLSAVLKYRSVPERNTMQDWRRIYLSKYLDKMQRVSIYHWSISTIFLFGYWPSCTVQESEHPKTREKINADVFYKYWWLKSLPNEILQGRISFYLDRRKFRSR